MSRIHYTKQLENLGEIPVLINDIQSDSYFFKVRELPDVLTPGAQGFFLLGDPYLAQNSTVFVELVDRLGNTIFSNPIRNYTEGLARFVSLEVYETVETGRCTLFIVGETTRYRDGTPVPPEWRGRSNVRWTYTTIINTNIENSSNVRFLTSPELIVHNEYLLNELRIATTPVSASLVGASCVTDATNTQFLLVDPLRRITSAMRNGIIYSSSIPVAQIDRVLTDGVIRVSPFTSSMWTSYPSVLSLLYDVETTRIPSEQKKSYLDVEWTNLRSFSGFLSSASLALQYTDVDSSLVDLQSADIVSEQLLTVYSGDILHPFVDRGSINDLSITYWTAGTMDSY